MWKLKTEKDFEQEKLNYSKSDRRDLWQLPLIAFAGTVSYIMLDLGGKYGGKKSAHQIKSFDDLPNALMWAGGIALIVFLFRLFKVSKDTSKYLCIKCSSIQKHSGICTECSCELVDSQLWVWKDEDEIN